MAMTLDWLEILTRIGSAALIGAGVGLNRHLHHKFVGVRTLALIGASAAGLVMATLHGSDGALHYDAMSRAIQGIMTGLGFIGAGVIMRGPGDTKVHGLTTAAAVWTTAALGILSGTGAWRIVIVLTAIATLVLLFGGPLERKCRQLLHGEHHDEGNGSPR